MITVYYNGNQFYRRMHRFGVIQWQGTESPVRFGEKHLGGIKVS
jgi:hypothetical protein